MNISGEEFEVLETLMRTKELPLVYHFALVVGMASKGLIKVHIDNSVIITEEGEEAYLTQGGAL